MALKNITLFKKDRKKGIITTLKNYIQKNMKKVGTTTLAKFISIHTLMKDYLFLTLQSK